MNDERRAGQSATIARPPTPCVAWVTGEQAHGMGIPRSACPFTYPGSRWEWEAGWDYAEQESRR